jgi:hypothetical protein
MLDAACGDTHRGGRPSIPPSATDPAAITVAAETTTRPPSSVIDAEPSLVGKEVVFGG